MVTVKELNAALAASLNPIYGALSDMKIRITDVETRLMEKFSSRVEALEDRIKILEEERPKLEARLLKLEESDVAEGMKEKMETAWSEVVAKKRPGVLSMGSLIREQLHQQRLTDDRKANIIVYGLKADNEVPDKGLFMSIVRASNMGNEIKDEDVECLRLGKPAEGAVQPLRVVLHDAEMKLKLFKNLKHWREKFLSENGQDTVLPSLEHDLTREQRAEKKTLLADARSKQGELPVDSLFRIRVRGPPERMRIVKIDEQGKWVNLDM
jgi:hypothetical protein